MKAKLLKITALFLLAVLLITASTAFAARKKPVLPRVTKINLSKFKLPITLTGTVKKFSVSIHMQGKGYYLTTENGRRILLKSKIDFKKYLGKEVKARGLLRNAVNARIGVLEVTAVSEKVNLTGTIKEAGYSIFMQGSGYAIDTGDQIYLLDRNEDINFADYVDKQVNIIGFARPSVEAGRTIIEIISITLI